MSIYKERLDRTLAAVALEPVDRVPVSYLGTAVNAQFAGVSLARYCNDMEFNCSTNLKAMEMVGEVDSTQATIFFPRNLSATWLSEVVVPGDGLPDNELWQVHEKELISQSDYDLILDMGFGPWYEKFLREKVGDPNSKNGEFLSYMPESVKRFADAGIPSINSGSCISPFEMLCGGRSLISFLTDDLIDIPDKLEEVFKVAHEFNMNRFEARFRNSPAKPIGVWVGVWRGTPNMLSPEHFERFSWKYIKELVDMVVSYDVLPILHLDANWDNGIKYFHELPRGKCVMALDGQTDIFRAREIIGDHMCIMGDVPSHMMAFSKPDEISDYCKKLIKTVGPKGFILSSGCDIPYNAKLENVQAMVASVKL